MIHKEEYQIVNSNILRDLFELIEIPSITHDRVAGEKAAKWIIERVRKTAEDVIKVDTTGNPVVIATWKSQLKSGSKIRLLLYGHYDVQSVEPLNEWNSSPFVPTIKDGRIYARGIGDNKGQFFAHLLAIELLHKKKQLPIDIKMVFDGDEERGSPTLLKPLMQNKEFLSSDLVVVSDGPSDPSWRPTIVFGARGIVLAKFQMRTANKDAHSGNLGGIQPNPVHGLSQILNTMVNQDGKCTVQGFYENVFQPDESALKAAAELGRTPDMYKKMLGIDYFGGEQDLPLTHRVIFRPTFNVRGIQSGFVGELAKTIIPREAIAEIDMRLVPNQSPKEIQDKVLKHLENLENLSSYWKSLVTHCKVTFGSSFSPIYTPLNLKWTEIIEQSITEGFGEKPLKIPLLGGSLPLDKLFEVTRCPLYVIPYAQPDLGNHAPNENLMIEWLESGIKTSVRLLTNLGEYKT
ncbi:MAG: M20/M25/M40 family metallo-hydrolase [Candidatus Hodarchaeales archaeon]|jgi:acetylornithine deacetylase/succinyl-diaminopimelate desuccinylase-like protein